MFLILFLLIAVNSGFGGRNCLSQLKNKNIDEQSERTPRVFPMRQSRKGAVFLSPMLLLLLATKVILRNSVFF
jgi:hypothetical protein